MMHPAVSVPKKRRPEHMEMTPKIQSTTKNDKGMHPLMSVREKKKFELVIVLRIYICVSGVHVSVGVWCVCARKRFCMYDDAVDDATHL